MDVDGQNILGVHRSRKQQLRRGSVYPARRWYPHVYRRLPRLLRYFKALSVQSNHILRHYARHYRRANSFRRLALH